MASIDDLIAAGRHAEAAGAAMRGGDPARAAALWERIWDYAAAARAWRSAGDLARALSAAIESRDDALTAELGADLANLDGGGRTALEIFARHRRHAAAAELAERLGEVDRAIDHYQRAHRELDAARLLETAGRDREAAQLLERAFDLAIGDDRAVAHLRLGRILTRRGRYDQAVRHLQEAARTPSTALEARHHLVFALASLGLNDAARAALLELRRADPSVTGDLGALIRAARGTALARPDRQLVAGRYRLESLLGSGGAGRVFRAVDEMNDRPVAIKMFFAAGAAGGPAHERFVREARLAEALRHPALVEVYEVSVDQGFLVMEYLAGGSLAHRLATGERPSGAQVRRLALELLSGLELAHHRGVIHRDVKPANIFFDERGAAKLGDFGVAHLVDVGQTQTGGLIGSLAYMAPEQITGAPITVAADLYALGVTLFESLTGRLPFLGPDFVAQHLGEPPPPPTALAEVAAGWDPILARLLRKSPTERHTSIAELRRDLDEIALGDRSGSFVAVRRPRRDSRPYSFAELTADEAPTEEPARYRFETSLGRGRHSRLFRAVDGVLDRSVIIERFDDGPEADLAIARVVQLARASSPFLQRALAFDRAARTAIFEAPAGAPLGDHRAIGATDAIRLLKRLARALAAIHELGLVHGAIDHRSVVIDDTWIPTVTAAGLPPAMTARPADDVDAMIALCVRICGVLPATDALAAPHSAADALAAHLAAGASPAALAALSIMPRTTGEELYAWADAIEIAALQGA